MSPERGCPFDKTPFQMRSDEEHDPEVSRKLIKSTKDVIGKAMRLVEQEDTETSHGRYVRVRDPKIGQSFSLYAMSDEYVSGQYEYRRHNALMITPMGLNKDGVLEPKREEGILLPDNPSHLDIENLCLGSKGLEVKAMKKLARQLKRAVPMK